MGRDEKKRGHPWSPIEEVIDSDNPDVKTFSAKTEDGVFEVIGRYSGKPVDFSKQYSVGRSGSSHVTYDYRLEPNKVKFDYIIRDFPFLRNNSMLALDGRFKSKVKAQKSQSYKNMLKAPKDNESDVGARFTWAETVNVDGIEKPVFSSLDETTQKDDDE